tara:strand:- start:367 stop:873 length:507 start_codon:yes stop_codon:yes gene_type:complete
MVRKSKRQPSKYDEDKVRLTHIGDDLKSRIIKYHGTQNDAALVIAKILDRKVSWAKNFVNRMCNHDLLHELSSASSSRTNGESWFKPISALYFILGVKEDDEILAYTHIVNPSFRYDPPTKDFRDIREISPIVTVDFNDQTVHLTDDQIQSLEELANRYAIRNYFSEK